LGIAYVVVAVVSGSADKIVEAGLLVLLVVVLHNGLGYLLGYFASRIFRYPERIARTTAVEVGMQNSGLAATLAAAHLARLLLYRRRSLVSGTIFPAGYWQCSSVTARHVQQNAQQLKPQPWNNTLFAVVHGWFV